MPLSARLRVMPGGDEVAATADGRRIVAVGAGVEQQAGDVAGVARQPLSLFAGKCFAGTHQQTERQHHHGGEPQKGKAYPGAQQPAIELGGMGLLAVDDLFQAIEGFLQVGDQPAVVVIEGGFGLGAGDTVADFIVLLPLFLLAFLHHGDGTLLGLPGIFGLADRAAHHHRDKRGNQYTVNPFQHQHASVSDKRSATIANNCVFCRQGIAMGAWP